MLDFRSSALDPTNEECNADDECPFLGWFHFALPPPLSMILKSMNSDSDVWLVHLNASPKLDTKNLPRAHGILGSWESVSHVIQARPARCHLRRIRGYFCRLAQHPAR